MKLNTNWISVCVCGMAVGCGLLEIRAAEASLADFGPGTGVAINNNGFVVRNNNGRAYLHRDSLVIPVRIKSEWLPEPVDQVTAVDLNDSGVVVGTAFPPSLSASEFWWTETDSKMGVVTPTTPGQIQVRRINNGGFAAVYENTGFGGTYPFWPQLTTFQWYPDFVQLSGASIGKDMLGINDSQVMVGYGVRPEALKERARAVKVVGEVMTFLDPRDPGTGEFPINDPTTRLSEAFGINEGGMVVGRMAVTPGGPKHAFRWNGGNGLEDLGTLGGLESEALDVNDSGLIVGRSQTADGQWRAFVYENGRLVDLNTYVPAGVSVVLLRANRVNNQGQVVGDMRFNGATNAFVLSLSPAVDAPTITQQPTSQSAVLGQSVSFTVAASGSLPFQYQWWKGSEKLNNATNATLTLESVNGLSQGAYRVDVSNSGGSISSLPVTLTVLDPELTPYSMAALSIVGELGGLYRIDYRQNNISSQWVPLATIQLTNNPQWFIDVESATNRSRIYRSVRLGN